MTDFIKGMDLSTFLELEKLGARYYEEGKERELFSLLKEHDIMGSRHGYR